jgi:hypothetical protein
MFHIRRVQVRNHEHRHLPVAWNLDTRPQISQNMVETLVSAVARSSRQRHVDSPQADREFDLCNVNQLKDRHI